MLPTHVLVGLAIATPAFVLAHEHATAALAGGSVGSILPDLDLYGDHRRSLHHPTRYSIAAVPAVAAAGIFAVRPSTVG